MVDSKRSPYHLKKPLVLVGLPGVGKSYWGSRLSEVLGIPFLDTDTLVEEKLGVDVNWVFEKEGEEGFRKHENKALKTALASKVFSIISSGGGLVTQNDNRKLLIKKANVLHLKLSLTRHLQYLSGKKRPIFQKNEGIEETLTELSKTRAPFYDEVADVSFDITKGSVLQLIQLLLKKEWLRSGSW